MAKRSYTVLSSLFLVISLAATFVTPSAGAAVPAIFILGDSTVDVGTNNFVNGAQARANFPHNGVDFPHSRPTGRFSNGFNTADFLAKLLGFRRSPYPFLLLLTLKRGLQRPSFRGANFASGGSGLLDITGQMLVVPFSEQIEQFATVRSNLTVVRGLASTETLLSESMFIISTGSNDIFGYFGSNSTIPKEQFLALLMNAYESHIKALYELGARKFGIISVPPIGCCPSQRISNTTGGCLEPLNDFSRAFYSALDLLLYNISSQLPGMNYSLGNTYEITVTAIDNPSSFGFTDVKSACCGGGELNGQLHCTPTANLCPNRKKYLFWDLFHSTQIACYHLATTLYCGGPSGGPSFVTPIKFAQLANDEINCGSN